jgi:uncharacterized protein (DUF2237 family)
MHRFALGLVLLVLWMAGSVLAAEKHPPADEGMCVVDNGERTCLGQPPLSDKARFVPAPGATNVDGEGLAMCGTKPMTGFFRDGRCRTGPSDRGLHVVCAEMTDRFLSFTKAKGNDLSSPAPRYGFPGLRAGDRWCLCAARWEEARRAGAAPKVVLEATEKAALSVVERKALAKHRAARRPPLPARAQ